MKSRILSFNIAAFVLTHSISYGQTGNPLGALSKSFTASLSSPLNLNSNFQVYDPTHRLKPSEADEFLRNLDLRKPIIYNNRLNKTIPELEILQMAQGGTNGAGGGGGVACLKDPMKPISTENIQSLYAVDYWEWEIIKSPKIGSEFIQPTETDNLEKYLQRIIDLNGALNKTKFKLLLENAIKDVLGHLKKRSYRLTDNESYTNDRGNLIDNDKEITEKEGCRFVQLAWREPMLDGKEYKISFNFELFNNLGVSQPEVYRNSTRLINQASLILHEALYLIGARLNQHPTSLSVRFMVNRIMMRAFPYSQDYLRLKYNIFELGFDHYYQFFSHGKKIDSIKSVRREAYKSLEIQIGNIRRVLLPISSKFFIFESEYIRNPLVSPTQFGLGTSLLDYKPEIAKIWYQILVEKLIPQLTEEEALMFAARLVFDEYESTGALGSLNFESLLIDGVEDTKSLRAVCGLNQFFNGFLYYNKGLVQELRQKFEPTCEKVRQQN